MKKYLKYILRGLKILLVTVVVLYAVLYIYVAVNKKSIIKDLTETISKKINGELTIGDAEISFFSSFPKIAVVLTDVSLKDTQFQQHHHPFFTASKVYARMAVWKLITKKPALNGLKINDGSVYLYTDTSGYSNKYLLNPKKDGSTPSSSGDKNELQKIELINTRIVLDDKEKGKLYDFVANNLEARVSDDGDVLAFAVKSNMVVNNLVFNMPKGGFVKGKTVEGKYNLRFDKKLLQLQFDSIDLKIGDHAFNLTGRFDIGEIPGRIALMDLSVHTKKIEFEFAKSLLAPKIAKGMSIVTMSNTLDVDARVSGPLKGGDQLVNASWITKNNNLVNPLLNVENSSFTGSYTNEVVVGQPRKDPNSRIELYHFTGEWKGLPVSSDKIVVTNFIDPLLQCDIHSAFALNKLNPFFDNSSIGLGTGDASVNISYKGAIKNNTSGNSFVSGTVLIKNGLVTYTPRNIPLKNVNGTLLLTNSDLLVQNLQCQVLGSQVVMNGTAKNLLTLMDSEPNKVILDWNIYSPSLNLAAFTQLLQVRKNINSKNQPGGIRNLSQKIDDVLEKGSINVTLKADNLLYNKFQATNAAAVVTILQNSWEIPRVSLQHAGGKMDLSGSLTDRNINYHQARFKVNLKDVDVSKTFAAFNNFGQDGITAQSIRGKLSAGINISLGLDDAGNVLPSSVEGVVDFLLKEGALVDYEPIKKVQDIVFKKRDFANISFATLKDKLLIKNKEVTINRMEIQSTVLSMFIEGIYSTQGNTDLSIQVPLSNLKRRDSTYVPENIGVNTKAGMSIYLRGTPGPDGNVKFKYDLFKKFRKGN
ncbi:MAG: AsmA-like C-terminal region-containing protein [Chitinophagaceae bacterium]